VTSCIKRIPAGAGVFIPAEGLHDILLDADRRGGVIGGGRGRDSHRLPELQLDDAARRRAFLILGVAGETVFLDRGGEFE